MMSKFKKMLTPRETKLISQIEKDIDTGFRSSF